MRSIRTMLLLLGLALLAVFAYSIVKDYDDDPSLMMTVVMVRLVAGYGFGAGIALMLALIFRVFRRKQTLNDVVLYATSSGTLVVVGLVALNLVQGS